MTPSASTSTIPLPTDSTVAPDSTNPRPFRYRSAEFDGATLTWYGELPVLFLRGHAERYGRQTAELALKQCPHIVSFPTDCIRDHVPVPFVTGILRRLCLRKSRRMVAQFPDHLREEMEGIISAGFARDDILAGNTFFDMTVMGLRGLFFGCSSVMVSKDRSATGGLLFGRNLDYPTRGYLQHHSLVMTYPRTGDRHAFVSFGFPGYTGCISGMNEYGLCVARHEVLGSRVSRAFDSTGLTFGTSLRIVLERCATVEEAAAELRSLRHAVLSSMVIADARGGRIVELAPGRVAERPKMDGFALCVNHFLDRSWTRRPPSNEFGTLDRLAILAQTADRRSWSVESVRSALHSVHKGDMTMQSMVFEPSRKVVHLGIGDCPVTARPFREISITELIGRADVREIANADLQGVGRVP